MIRGVSKPILDSQLGGIKLGVVVIILVRFKYSLILPEKGTPIPFYVY